MKDTLMMSFYVNNIVQCPYIVTCLHKFFLIYFKGNDSIINSGHSGAVQTVQIYRVLHASYNDC